MIEIVKGDLIQAAKDGKIDFLLHGANCFSTMGAGIAKQIKEEFPRAYNVDAQSSLTPEEKLGSYTMSRKAGDVTIVNMYTQYHLGPNFEYGALKCALFELTDEFNFDGKVIGLPKIGCGIGGGDWDIVYKILNRYSYDGKWIVYEL